MRRYPSEWKLFTARHLRRVRRNRRRAIAILVLLGLALWGSRTSSAEWHGSYDPLPDPCALDLILCPDEVGGRFNAIITGYNSVQWQTDSSPCISADGSDICTLHRQGENTCAANFLPFGTRLWIRGLGECTVRDRMASRFPYRVDWYFWNDIAAAWKHGLQHKAIIILK